ncbi:MAG: hypoxanthine phosphoribosyltransferase [Anaerolineae bacterium]|nr:hypoxanthine phosphoribosyltransferase [Anaerolineae bacterium]MDW8100574.1 hypoxanthine phosphoribosyltransferase [Anaerolineae bacterium]
MGKDHLLDDVARILITEQELRRRITELGEQISHDYQGRPLLLVAVLKGSVMFLADLMRAIHIPHAIDFMATSSYGSGTHSSGVVRILKDLDEPIEGKDVLLVEDIIDTGHTLDYLLRILEERRPNSLRVCALLDKRERREVEVPVHYVGFTIPNEFVIGYGLDYAQIYRNLPFIGVLKPEVYQKTG